MEWSSIRTSKRIKNHSPTVLRVQLAPTKQLNKFVLNHDRLLLNLVLTFLSHILPVLFFILPFGPYTVRFMFLVFPPTTLVDLLFYISFTLAVPCCTSTLSKFHFSAACIGTMQNYYYQHRSKKNRTQVGQTKGNEQKKLSKSASVLFGF